MATKKGAGGKPQEYDKESGKYGSDTGKLVNAVRKYSDDPERDLKNIPRVKNAKMTNRDWARFYSKLGELQTNKNNIYFTSEGYVAILLHQMNENDIPKVVFSTNDYPDPDVKQILSFDSDDEMYAFFEEINNVIK